MENLKKYGLSLGYTFMIIIIFLLLVTVFNYFNIIGPKLLVISKILIILLSLFVGGYINGKNSEENGWLEGLKLSFIFIIIILLISLFIPNFNFSVKTFIFYLICTGMVTFGSMIGINKRKENTV
jgi:putative membrane protein, TIGR04086 family/integral membrane protein, TIGR04097 family